MRFTLNGFEEEMKGVGLAVQELLDQLQEDDPAVIVELNGRFVHRKDFAGTKVQEGDKVELIHPSFGG